MKPPFLPLAAATSLASASSLTSLCASSNVKSALPSVTGLVFGDVTAAAVYNTSVASSSDHPAVSGRNFCNVTVNYSHDGKSDSINVWYYLPDPAQYEGRYLTTGGGGFAINSGARGLEEGLVYGAASGCTDGGMGWGAQLNEVILKANGSMDYDMLNNFGYLSLHELTVIGKGLTKNFYNSSKVWSYYHGCSEGGREGMSQVQRYEDQFDGAAVGAPAFRQAFQQPNHDWPQIFETSQLDGYAPSACALSKIVNETINACDALDGRVDGVISRPELCSLHYNATAAIGKAYSCAASTSRNPITGGTGASSPAANGTVNEKDVAVFLAVQNGPYDSQGRHLYIGFNPGTDTSGNAAGTYNTNTSTYDVEAISGIGAEWITYFLRKVISESLSLDGVTVDTLRSWMIQGQQEYAGTMNVMWTDLSGVRDAGKKVIHYHGEADNSIPTLSSVIYWEQVRRVLYPDATFEDSANELAQFYKFFLVPGAVHCGAGDNNLFPNTVLGSVIEWVENGVEPVQLNATYLSGSSEGEIEQLCAFPYRPQWSDNSTTHDCVLPDQDALDALFPVLDSTAISPYGDA